MTDWSSWEKTDTAWSGGGAAENKWDQQGAWGNKTEEAAVPFDPWAAAAGHDQQQQQEQPQQDAWQAKDSWGQPEDSWGQKDKPPPATEFWDTQKWNKESGVLSRKEDWELERDDVAMFEMQGRATAGLNFSKYENVPVDISGSKANAIPVCKTFNEMYEKFATIIPDALVSNLKRVQYEIPTPVQKFAMPCGLAGRDIMCCAQTGSGKTAAFLIPIIGRMMKSDRTPVGSLEVPFEGVCAPDTLVLTPVRELCIQIFEEAEKFCHRTSYRVTRVYGGESPKIQQPYIAKGTDMMVATPGRLQDFINRGIISVKDVHVLVLDEADRMLDMGFESQVREIVEQHGMPMKEERQTMMFSATFPEVCQKMAADFLYEYIWIAVGVIGSAVETVQQILKQVSPSGKFEELIAILDDFFTTRQNKGRMLVFVNAKDTAKWLDEQLYEKKFDTGALHGNLDQSERETNLGRFRKGEIDIMVATDVAARGLDIENVAVVVNYDLPKDSDTYIHRIGRTGRIGNDGKAITFLSCDEGGTCLEGVDILKAVCEVMKNSSAELPDWMQPLIETTEAGAGGGWGWGGKDHRAGQVEETTWTGSGDAWSNWDKSAAAGGDASAGWENKADNGNSGWSSTDKW